MVRLMLLALAACLCAGCAGGSAAKPDEIARCIEDAGGSVKLGGASDAAGVAPALTPDTEIVARGTLKSGTSVDVFVTDDGRAERAEERAVEFVRLFGGGEDDVLRRGDTVLMLGPRAPRADRELAERCLG